MNFEKNSSNEHNITITYFLPIVVFYNDFINKKLSILNFIPFLTMTQYDFFFHFSGL
jgi:hypothetical protein